MRAPSQPGSRRLSLDVRTKGNELGPRVQVEEETLWSGSEWEALTPPGEAGGGGHDRRRGENPERWGHRSKANRGGD